MGEIINMQFKVITLEWKEIGINIDKIEKIIEPKDSEVSEGIYQFYGDSPIYGRDVLLYIGQTKNIHNRFRSHKIIYQNNLSCRVAKLKENLLDIAESILIATHKPSLNCEYIDQPSETTTCYMIQNHGERGALTLQVTNSYWVKDGCHDDDGI